MNSPATETAVGELSGETPDADQRDDSHDGALLAGDVETYRLGRVLGEGGMGTVHCADRLSDTHPVAVKLVRVELLTQREFKERLRREVSLLRRFSHPNVVNLLDAGDDAKRGPFAVFEFLEGTSLGEMLDEHGRLTIGRALSVMDQVLDAMDAAHAVGVLHRDLKPDNIFVIGGMPSSDAIRVKVLDFGIGRLLVEHDVSSSNPRLTLTGTVLGTPSYMAPEQAMGERVQDHRVDIYSAGVVLYQLLSNTLPHEGDNYNQVLVHVMDGTVVPLTERVRGLDPELAAIVHRALDHRPAWRFPTAASFREALLAWRNGHDEAAARLTEPGSTVVFVDSWFAEPHAPSHGVNDFSIVHRHRQSAPDVSVAHARRARRVRRALAGSIALAVGVTIARAAHIGAPPPAAPMAAHAISPHVAFSQIAIATRPPLVPIDGSSPAQVTTISSGREVPGVHRDVRHAPLRANPYRLR